MTNAELVEALSKLPPDLPVYELHEGYAYYEVGPPVLRRIKDDGRYGADVLAEPGDEDTTLIIALDGNDRPSNVEQP